MEHNVRVPYNDDHVVEEGMTFTDHFGVEHRICGFFTGTAFKHYLFTDGVSDPEYPTLRFIWRWEYIYDPEYSEGLTLTTAEQLKHPYEATIGDLIGRAFMAQEKAS